MLGDEALRLTRVKNYKGSQNNQQYRKELKKIEKLLVTDLNFASSRTGFSNCSIEECMVGSYLHSISIKMPTTSICWDGKHERTYTTM